MKNLLKCTLNCKYKSKMHYGIQDANVANKIFRCRKMQKDAKRCTKIVLQLIHTSGYYTYFSHNDRRSGSFRYIRTWSCRTGAVCIRRDSSTDSDCTDPRSGPLKKTKDGFVKCSYFRRGSKFNYTPE